MKSLALTSDQARAIAHKAGVCFEIVSRAVDTSKAEARPVMVAMHVRGGEAVGGPPKFVLMVMFTAGHPEPRRNGWAGCAAAPISDQKELQYGTALVARTAEIVASEIDATLVRL